MNTTTARPPAVMRALIGGDVHVPGDPGYDAARACFNVTVDQRPAAIVEPRSAEEVATVIRFAAAEGMRVAPQRTGHNAAPLGPLEGSILLKTDRLDRVCIDAPARRARVGAGTRWEDVVPDASELGLACLHGSTPDVSVVGYSLGGGMGWYARKHGLAANHVTAIEVVTPDGQIRWATHQHDAELFWALRGGGGNFGVVTAIEFELQPLEQVYAGVLFFPVERAREVLQAWRAWTADAPEEVTSVGRIIQFPPFEEVPEPVRGKSFALVEAVFLTDEEAAARMLEPLRQLGPVMDTFASMPPAGIAELHMDPRDPVPYDSAHAMLGELDAAAIDRLVEAAGAESGSTLISVELRQAGGALARTSPGAGAVATLPGEFAFFAVGIADPEMAPKTSADLDRVAAAVHPYAAGHYFNFVEEKTDAASFFAPAVTARLEAARDTYDPERLMQANHEIGAAAEAAPREERTKTMTMKRTDKIIATTLAFCAAIALAAAFTGKADAATYGNGFQVAKFKIEIEGTQNTVYHRSVEATDECGVSDHSFGREKVSFHTTKPIYVDATHMPGEFNPQMFATKQLGIPSTAKVQRSYTPVITGPAIPCEENGGGAEATKPDCGTRTVKGWKLNLQYATDKKNALLLSGSGDGDPYVNCPGNGTDGFPWLLVEESGHQGKYIYAEVSQDELFDPKFQKWIAIGHGSAKDSGSGWWSKTEITYSVSFTRLKK